MADHWESDTEVECARRLLEMVRELHLLGYEQLRIAPAMAPSGLFWRVSICCAANTRPEHGAEMIDFDKALHYSSGSGSAYFDWVDADGDSPRKLAEKFVLRFPGLAEEGLGRDRDYVLWYEKMLEVTGPGGLPYAYADWPSPSDRLSVIGRGRDDEVELPPPA